MNNKKHGFGTYHFQNGLRLTCTFVNGVAMGKGKFENNDGYSYIGDIMDNKKHGKGKEKYENGDLFVGIFEDGKKKFGVYTSVDGDEYHGPYQDNKMNGIGVLTNADGSFYKGLMLLILLQIDQDSLKMI